MFGVKPPLAMLQQEPGTAVLDNQYIFSKIPQGVSISERSLSTYRAFCLLTGLHALSEL